MTLYLRDPESNAPAWSGYQFAVNRVYETQGKAVIEVCEADGAFQWRSIGSVDCICEGNRLQLAIPKAMLGLEAESFDLEFKWSDNLQEANVMDFYVNGDTAPIGRFNYLYREKK